ncbi:MAG: 30S ribosomal protein S6 [Proteobacteria bacterium]|nr:30S ribosomal protein S6 [Pseudomonadota bacterium]
MTNRYEVVVVLDSALNDAEVSTQIEKIVSVISAHDGQVERQEIWGRRELAYMINKKTHGIYLMIIFSAKPTAVADLKRQLRINEQALRSLVVKKDKYAPDTERSFKDEGRDDRELPELDIVTDEANL